MNHHPEDGELYTNIFSEDYDDGDEPVCVTCGEWATVTDTETGRHHCSTHQEAHDAEEADRAAEEKGRERALRERL